MADTRTLTDREREILRSYGRGAEIRVIAELQDMPRHAVASLLTQLCGSDRAEARAMTRPDAPAPIFRQPEPAQEPTAPPVPAAPAETRPPARLSPRLRKLLQLIVDGHDRPAIAEQLGLTDRTVKAYIQDLYRILNVHNVTDAVAAAHAMGMEAAPIAPPTWPVDLTVWPENIITAAAVEPDVEPEPAAPIEVAAEPGPDPKLAETDVEPEPEPAAPEATPDPEPVDPDVQAKLHQQILDYLADGFTFDDIVAELGLTDDELRDQLRTLYRTLATGSRPALSIATRIGINDTATVIAEYRAVHCETHRWTGIAGEHDCPTRPVRVQILELVA